MLYSPPPLDNTLYSPSPDELAFLSQSTSITDPLLLKNHILDVQRQAYAVHPYPCIRRFSFTTLKISRYPTYTHLLNLPNLIKDPVFLDLGCCFGNDPRKLIADGFPSHSVYASDLRPEFWDLGHKLFQSNPSTCPIKFIPGDVFDSKFLPLQPVAYPSESTAPTRDLPILPAHPNSLSPLIHRVDAIHTSSFFHLFDEEQQSKIAHRLAGLLSPLPGAIIFGSHIGSDPTLGYERPHPRFGHTVDSWNALWNGQVFRQGTVECKASIRAVERKDLLDLNASGDADAPLRPLLIWSVRRL